MRPAQPDTENVSTQLKYERREISIPIAIWNRTRK